MCLLLKYVNRKWLQCMASLWVAYADDIIILWTSVCGLQNRLDCVYEVSHDLHLTSNCAKSSCFATSKGNKLRISDIPKEYTVQLYRCHLSSWT